MYNMTILTFQSPCMKFCGILDVLSLPAATARLHSYSPVHDEEGADTEGMEVIGEEESHVRSETPLLLSWKRLQSVLGCTFSDALRLKGHSSYELLCCLEHSYAAKSSSRFEMPGKRVDMFSAMCVRLSRTMSTLLTATSNEELYLIMEQLLCIKVQYLVYLCVSISLHVNVQEPFSVSSVLTFCFSWCVVVGSTKLPQEKRSLIRKYLQKAS